MTEAEDAVLEEFKNDLKDMSLDEMKRELEQVEVDIDPLEAWQEALSIAIRRAELE
jgi:hypothetical protein